jgi:hypothetical protein
MINSTKLINSTKTMILMALLATLMVASLAAPAIAKENNHNNGSNETAPLKDKGITSCDLTPSSSGCKSTSEPAVDSSNNAPKDQGKNSCEFSFAKCDSSTQPTNDSEKCQFSFARCDISTQSATDPEHNPGKDSAANTSTSPDKDKPLKDQGITSCDLKAAGCQSATNTATDPEHNNAVKDSAASNSNSVADPKTANDKDKNATKDIDLRDGQGATDITDSDVHSCPYADYNYDSDLNTCIAPVEWVDTLGGDRPWPKSVGGYVGLVGHLPGDFLQGATNITQIGLHAIGDNLVDFGEGGGPIGWGIQGVGYTLGFAGDAAGTIVGGAAEVVDAVAYGVGDAVDAVGDAIGSLF